MIEKLKKAGLGYNVSEKDTKDKFGKLLSLAYCKLLTPAHN